MIYRPGKTYRIVPKSTGLSVAVEAASLNNGAKIFQWDFGSTLNDQWEISGVGGGYFKIINRLSGKALNVANNSLIAGGKMIQWPYSAADNMTFQLIPLN
ncbi:RICIN domain-containing protein [Paenibacillus frigoriresistens]|uniref:RICIN domain-containing protein n=1 Tax=Paenibacillus alginolyticus TaxID=59839 RepID=UPI001566761B|nr:RICIN domain-containing protein [Paenibacillus frigoriresistens]NRF90291.1 RICIN domain-containing protein [Paenibacillus frigoriresistens]